HADSSSDRQHCVAVIIHMRKADSGTPQGIAMKNILITVLSIGALATTAAGGMEAGDDQLATPGPEAAKQLRPPSTIAVQLEQLHAVEDSGEHSGNERDR